MLCKLEHYLQARFFGASIIPLPVASDLSQASLEYALEHIEANIVQGVHLYDSLSVSCETIGVALSIVPAADFSIISIDKELVADAWYYGRCVRVDDKHHTTIIYSEGA